MNTGQISLLDGVSAKQPELTRALELQRRAAQVGFDWDSMPPVLAKIREELAELEIEIARGARLERLQDELGDLLFAIANLARKLNVIPENALRGTNDKFKRRFSAMESGLAKQGRRLQDASLAEMDALWEQAKHDEP